MAFPEIYLKRKGSFVRGPFLFMLRASTPSFSTFALRPAPLLLPIQSHPILPENASETRIFFPLPPLSAVPGLDFFLSFFFLSEIGILVRYSPNFHIESIPKATLESVFRLLRLLPFLLLFSFAVVGFSAPAPENSAPRVSDRRSFSIGAMKVHPVPKKRSISTIRYDLDSSVALLRQKKLRRLPHIFSRVLELPFRSDADVLVQETPESFRFIVTTDDITNDVQAHTINICPGVTKIVIRGRNVFDLSFAGLELDLWRFRLPPTTRPELASAAHVDGDLVVTVPKGVGSDGGDDGEEVEAEEEDGFVEGGAGHLVLVQ